MNNSTFLFNIHLSLNHYLKNVSLVISLCTKAITFRQRSSCVDPYGIHRKLISKKSPCPQYKPLRMTVLNNSKFINANTVTS